VSAAAQTISVLLVEDSPDDVFFFKRALEKSGAPATLRVAEDGAAAIRLLLCTDQPLPRVMFLDLKMPNVNGFEVLQWLQRQDFKSAIRVVVLSSSDEPREIQMARSLGASDYLIKPVATEKLRQELLRTALPDSSPQPAPLNS
jgi:CheY-like chemotaxis protein